MPGRRPDFETPAVMYSTAGLSAAAGGAFHAVWVDGRTGVGQAWTATVTVRGER